MRTITADKLQQQVEAGENLNIIDVREADEVVAGMIPGAKHIPLGEVEERIGELDADKEYYMVCRAGRRSEMACGILESSDFNTVNVEGGMTSWNGETIA
ncbi:Rhodanese-related sulfurtransferase [Planococcus antarcticus DSM 14505]|uniref:Rhodanese n=1 Tax=Planococcus antarcticus DSM 14505 TaxID=1185653 RepID=A0A1C7DGQ2_9BACL|nr:rhodanese-like domain-containing protein [Planococcus antarcticus]ANU10588.1 rhodanese [Planococcus antarcticus DSM 14505]EIM06668.1 Rhodanese-related sulfurtransferase [Planococcus antarcticus DSM 14505]